MVYMFRFLLIFVKLSVQTWEIHNTNWDVLYKKDNLNIFILEPTKPLLFDKLHRLLGQPIYYRNTLYIVLTHKAISYKAEDLEEPRGLVPKNGMILVLHKSPSKILVENSTFNHRCRFEHWSTLYSYFFLDWHQWVEMSRQK